MLSARHHGYQERAEEADPEDAHRCRRCGRTSFHIQKKVCSACGYPAARNRHYNWAPKMIRRKNKGTGRMRYEKELPRRFKNGFREQTQAPSRKRSTAA